MTAAARLLTFLLSAVSIAAQSGAPAAQPEPPARFARFVTEGDGGHLDVAATTYRKGEVTVTLYGSVHVADRAHYEELQRRFAGHDALLFEFVGNPMLAPRPGTAWRDEPALGVNLDMQLQLAFELEAMLQFEVLDYRRDNFVHADFDARAWLQHRKQCEAELDELRTAELGDLDRPAPAAIEAAFAQGFGHHLLRMWRARSFASAVQPPRSGMLVIEGRNDRCLAVLQQQIAAGKRDLGVYYGFLHLPHLQRRLLQDLGFVCEGQQWLLAIDCKQRPDAAVTTQRWRSHLLCKQVAALARKAERPLPDLQALRAQAALPDDGKDAWGRDLLVRTLPKAPFLEVRSAGGDGEFDTFDDLVDGEQPSLRPLASLRLRAQRRQQAEQFAASVRKVFGVEPTPARPKPPADVRALRARADAMRIRTAVEQWRLGGGAGLPSIAQLQQKDASGAVLLVGCDRDPWGGSWRIELQDGGVVVSSNGPDGKPGTDDDVGS